MPAYVPKSAVPFGFLENQKALSLINQNLLKTRSSNRAMAILVGQVVNAPFAQLAAAVSRPNRAYTCHTFTAVVGVVLLARVTGEAGGVLTLLDIRHHKANKENILGWESLKEWGNSATQIETLSGGVANDVWSVRINGKLVVGRLGKRSDADLDWEMRLLAYLDQNGLTVPVPIPTVKGKLFANGLVVMSYVEGEPPETEADWQRVGKTLRRLHQLTREWPQRPGWRSSLDLLHETSGTKIDLDAMPQEGVARCRAAWARLKGRQTAVVHGDPNPRNIRITADRVALIDWDESHVDVPELDLALPHNAAALDDDTYDIVSQASSAWEAAVCWDDDYSRKRLAEVREISEN